MRRRDFIAGIVCSATASPLAASAQQSGRLPTIGFLGSGAPTGWESWTNAFIERLRRRGWIDGRNVTIEYRWAEGRPERYAEIAAEFVRLKVDVIVSSGSAVAALMQATSTVPIVFAVATDPVGQGLVASLAHPGGNVTGLSAQATDIAGKRIELLRQVVPDLHKLALLGNVNYSAGVIEMGEVQAVARKLGLEVVPLEIRQAGDIRPAFAALNDGANALYVVADGLVGANLTRINTLALGAQLPTIYNVRDYVESGGLMSYGADTTEMFRRAADLVDKILRGANPGDIPVEQPTKFELVINLTTAQALKLKIPGSLLSLADEVIE